MLIKIAQINIYSLYIIVTATCKRNKNTLLTKENILNQKKHNLVFFFRIDQKKNNQECLL